METERFQEGYLLYEVHIDVADFRAYDWSIWEDGYLAFSNNERRFHKAEDPEKIPQLLSGENQRTDHGYLMELDLWRAPSEGVLRELVLQREGASFFVQDWTLWPNPPEGQKPNCYFAEAETRPLTISNGSSWPKGTLHFKPDELRAMEVVVPDMRLHFFITTGGK